MYTLHILTVNSHIFTLKYISFHPVAFRYLICETLATNLSGKVFHPSTFNPSLSPPPHPPHSHLPPPMSFLVSAFQWLFAVWWNDLSSPHVTEGDYLRGTPSFSINGWKRWVLVKQIYLNGMLEIWNTRGNAGKSTGGLAAMGFFYWTFSSFKWHVCTEGPQDYFYSR